MKIILINGQPGTGKSVVADALKNDTQHSAYIDADALINVNPLGFNEDRELLLGNASALVKNFLQAGFTTIFTAGLTRNQVFLNDFIERIGKDIKIVFVWLYATKEVKMKRKSGRSRDIADKDEHFDTIEKMYPDARPFKIVNGIYTEIDTSLKSVQETVKEIEKII